MFELFPCLKQNSIPVLEFSASRTEVWSFRKNLLKVCCLYNKGASSLPSVLSISGPSSPYSSTPWQSTCKEDEFCQSSLNMGRLEFRNARILAVGILFLFIVLLSLIVARPIEKHPSLPTLADQSGFQDHPGALWTLRMQTGLSR